MAKKSKIKSLETLTHEEATRKNIPTAEHQSIMHDATASGKVSISTMHLAKGLEFRAVVVMACDDEIIPLQERIETISDAADLQEVYDTERHLLYVACTRARDYLLVTSGDMPSEFLDDLRAHQ
jgi:superfamily I DNA/RNA helicase